LGTDFVTHAGLGGPNIVFNGSKDLKQLGNIVEKLTYMGTCDLFLDPACISLRTTMAECPPAVIGMLLERQLESLNRSLWKEGVSRIVSTLFLHAREVYVGDEMPIRRARILLGCMDFVYHMGPEKVIHLGCPQEMGDELEKLLTRVVGTYTHLEFEQSHEMLARTLYKTVHLPSSASNIGPVRICGSQCTHIVVWANSRVHWWHVTQRMPAKI
jgi:hypothetical protein